MELYHLQYVLTLARELNFSRAAAALFITQPTLSQQIMKLETELGFPLFQRNTRSVVLTPYGEQFVARAQRIVSEFDSLKKWTLQMSELKHAKIAFGASPISMPHVSDIIPDFFAQFPDVRFSYVEKWDPELVDMVKSGALDIALVALSQGEPDRDGLYIVPIRDEYVCAVVSDTNPLCGRRSVSLRDLVDERIILTSSHSGLRRLMQKQFDLQGLTPNFAMDVISIEARLSMVMKGAITFVMNEQFKLYNREGICVIPLEPKLYRTFALITAADRKISVWEKAFLQIASEGISSRLNKE